MSESDESIEVERIFLRLGSAENDEQLEICLNKFLTFVLLKLVSPTEGVRKKVMELLVHVNKRIKGQSNVQLPMAQLFKQYQDSLITPFVTNFTVIYIKMGYSRLSVEKQIEFLPELFNCCKDKSESQQSIFFHLIVSCLQHLKFPTTNAEKESFFVKDIPSNIQAIFLNFLFDILLLPYSGDNKIIAPGLSEKNQKLAYGDGPLIQDNLEKSKLFILQLISCGVFESNMIGGHIIIATADPRHSVVSSAELKMKQLFGKEDWNDSILIKKLYNIFLGTAKNEAKVKISDKREPAGIPLRLKIYPIFLKSTESTKHFPHCIQIIFDCLFTPNSNAKLKQQSLQFVHHLCTFSPDDKFDLMKSMLFYGVTRLVKDEKEEGRLRGDGYLALGKIGSRAPDLITKDLSIIQQLFEELSISDNVVMKSQIQQCLSMLSNIFTNLENEKCNQMEAIVMHQIEEKEELARLMAVRYASSVFPTYHIPSRYALLLACGDFKEAVFSEASTQLKMQVSQLNTISEKTEVKKMKMQILFPQFQLLVNYIYIKAEERLKSSKKFIVGSHVLPFNPPCFIEILQYLRQCLAYCASANPNSIPSLESTATMKSCSPSIAKYIQSFTINNEQNPIVKYVALIKQLLTALAGPPAMYCLLEIVAICDKQFLQNLNLDVNWIKNFIYHSNDDMRVFATELYAIIIYNGNDVDKMKSYITTLVNDIQSNTLEIQLGSISCLGFLVGQISHEFKSNLTSIADSRFDKDFIKILENATNKIVDLLKNPKLWTVACVCLGEMGRRGNLNLRDDDDDEIKPSKKFLVNKLIDTVKDPKATIKVRETAGKTLSLLCVGEENFKYRQEIIENFLGVAAAKQYEFHYTIGEALVTTAQASLSAEARNYWTCAEEDYHPTNINVSNDEEMLLERLLKLINSQNPHIRQAACIWLMLLTKRLGDRLHVRSKLLNIQTAFVSLLGENDELTQDVVSRGLGIVYEKGTEEQKKLLVSSLIDTLSTGKRSKVEMTNDTKVFEEETLGKTPDGQNISTYKELCSIANDLNQPDLIYKFLHLANHQSTWNARRGAAFGFSAIIGQAIDQLSPHLDKILPKLFRYQFDPNPKIQAAMTSIWNALVTDKEKMLNKYFRDILEDVNSNLTNSQWRVRESSCMALNELIRGQSLDDVIQELPILWTSCLRVSDDIKESVRKAAFTALKSLSKATIKFCELSTISGVGSKAEKAIGLIYPVLLDKGLIHPVEEVKALCLSTLMKLAKESGSAIKPHIGALMSALLESITTLEPQALNYLTLRVSNDQQLVNKLDNARISAYKSSPAMEVINLCIQNTDSEVLKDLVPALIQQLKSAVGLGTKVCCSKVILSLIQHCPQDMKVYSGKLLGALVSQLNDRNASVRSAYAMAIGHLCKIAKDSSIDNLFDKLKSWYLEKDEESLRIICGQTLQAMNIASPDIIKNNAAKFLPLVFIAMHFKYDVEPELTSSQPYWEEIWNEAITSTEQGIKLYLAEILELLTSVLSSSSWALRSRAASSFKTLIEKSTSSLNQQQLHIILTALLDAIPGRTWPGKVFVLQSISAINSSYGDFIKQQLMDPSDCKLLTLLLKETERENLEYKMEVVKCLSELIEMHDIQLFDEVYNSLIGIITTEREKDTDELEKKREDRIGIVMESLTKCFPSSSQLQTLQRQKMADLFVHNFGRYSWKVDLILLNSIKKFIEKLYINCESSENIIFFTGFFNSIFKLLFQFIEDGKNGRMRLEAITAIEIACNKLLVTTDIEKILDKDNMNKMLTTMKNAALKDQQVELQRRAKLLISLLEKSNSYD